MRDQDINTHNLVCDFGRHAGELYTRIPVSYLTWMVNQNTSRSHIAAAELKRRGTVMPTLEISGHAIDRASLSCRKYWHETRGEQEGLNAWLLRVSKEALEKNEKDGKGRYVWGKIRLAIEDDGVWPVLKTVIYEAKEKL